MKNKLIALAAAFAATIGCCTAQSRAEVPAGEFEAALADKSKAINTIACDFVQTRVLSVLADEARKEGHFDYKRPGCLSLSFADGDLILMNGDRFRITSAGKTNTVKMSSNPMLREMKRIISACMTADVESLKAGFTTQLSQTGAEYILKLTPAARRSKGYVAAIVLHFDKRDMSLNILRMEEPSGDYTQYEFSNKKFNGPVPDALFAIE